MGLLQRVFPVQLFIGCIFNADADLDRVKSELVQAWGPIASASGVFPFTQTDYYYEEMGAALQKIFFAFDRLISPEKIAEIKIRTNAMELIFVSQKEKLKRNVNLDPGYLDASKVVLATTKNYSHRIYLRQGIYAEVTLNYREGEYRVFPWTYPDYKQDAYHSYFKLIREHYMTRLSEL